MSEERADAEVTPEHPPEPGAQPEKEEPRKKGPSFDRVVIWAWPKTIVFWPTCLAAIVFGFISMALNPEKRVETIKNEVASVRTQIAESGASEIETGTVKTSLDVIENEALQLSVRKHRWLGRAFLIILGFNFIAFSFDIRVKGMAITILIAFVVILALLWLSTMYDILPFLQNILDMINPYANATFYFTMGSVTLFILLCGMVQTYLHRWDVTHNEVVIRTGLLEAEKRLGTESLTFTKEITDLMEHWLIFFGFLGKRFGCGELVFNHPQIERPIFLDNVIGPESKAEQLGNILGVLAVKNGD